MILTAFVKWTKEWEEWAISYSEMCGGLRASEHMVRNASKNQTTYPLQVLRKVLTVLLSSRSAAVVAQFIIRVTV